MASLVAQLNHPRITRVFDSAQVNGVYYLAMELRARLRT